MGLNMRKILPYAERIKKAEANFKRRMEKAKKHEK